MRPLLIAGNWKCHLRHASARRLAEEVRQGLPQIDGILVALCPAFVHIPPVKEVIKGSPIILGAQDLHWQDDVAATGEVGPSMLAEWVEVVIIGHSERRRLFGESDEVVNRKVKAALQAGMRPILCIGETLEERQRGDTFIVLARQLEGALAQVDSPEGIVIAYEPVWAIGTHMAATGPQAQEVALFIRSWIGKQWDPQCADSVIILYGGSVTPQNMAEFATQPDIDGALVGGASLDSRSFLGIIAEAARAKGKPWGS